MPTEPRGN